jgi:hypothetical protein
MPVRRLPLLAVLTASACAAPPAGHAVPAAPEAEKAARAGCPGVLDVEGLLARHAGSFGAREAVARARPRSFSGEVVTLGSKGSAELVLGLEGRFSRTTEVGGMRTGSGVDAAGPWSLPYAGVPLRLRPDEAVEVAFGAWLEGRDYLTTFDRGRDTAVCTVRAAGPQVAVRYGLPAVGSPELTFRLADAALLSATHLDVHGHETVLVFHGWSDAEPGGVRWPLAVHSRDASGGETDVRWTASRPGAVCPSRPSEDCLAPPRSRLDVSWPAAAAVRAPAAFFMDEVLLQAKVGDHAFWALVDSGATLHFVDAGSQLAGAFQARVVAAPPATGGGGLPPLGELPGPVALGGLLVRGAPAAAIPLPSFDEFGARRPEALLGHPLFLGAAVRIDYAHQELLLAKDARALHAASALAIPLKVIGESLVVEARLDGEAGWFELDSASPEALDLYRGWATAHGFPGPRPTFTLRPPEVGSREGAGQRMRPATFELGPIHLAAPLVPIVSDRGLSDRIAGQVGNGVLGRCAAVVFDVEHRTLWLEPPCDRDVPEDLAGWGLARRDDPGHPDRPWVVEFVTPAGAADLAGVKAGDRLLQLGDRAAVLERSTFEAVTRQPPGTRIPAVLERGGERRDVTLTLARMLGR